MKIDNSGDFFFFGLINNVSNFIKNKNPTTYTGNVLQWQRSRTQITTINKIREGQRKTRWQN